MPEFECPGPIAFEVSIGAGAVEIIAEERGSTLVEVTPADDRKQSQELAEEARVEFENDVLRVIAPRNSSGWFRRSGQVRVNAKVPTDSDGVVKVASASVECKGRYGRFELNTASGKASVGHVGGDADVNSASGGIRIDSVGGSLKVNTASGGVQVQSVGGDFRANSASGNIDIGEVGGEARANTASGRVRFDRVGGDAQTKTASGGVEIGDLGGEFNGNAVSGDMRIGSLRRGTAEAKTVSGNVEFSVVPGTGVWMDLGTRSGHVTSELDDGEAPPDGHDLTIRVRTVSGNIDVLRAREAARV